MHPMPYSSSTPPPTPLTSSRTCLLRINVPKVIVYDIAPPYERNWAYLQHLRRTVLDGYRFVLTSVNVKHVERLVGSDERVYEVVGTPHDLDQIVRATKEAAKARPTR
jgi:hypothetical protein